MTPRPHWFTAPVIAAVLLATHSALAQSTKFINLGRGDVPVYLPDGYDENVPIPLIVMLHGYSSSGAAVESYFRFRAQQDTYRFILTTPDGARDFFNNRYWNATDACCDFFNSNIDDSGYLRALIEAIDDQCAVDDRRIYVVGHSNGGFMAHRLACEHADRIAAVASLAGATFNDPDDCLPTEPVNVLQIHGTDDTVIWYEGGFIGNDPYPGALQTAEQWAAKNGCDPEPDTSAPPLNLDRSIPGDETLRTIFDLGCAPGGSAELWTIVGGAHSPDLSAEFAPTVIEWLLDHASPCPADFNGDGEANSRDVLAFLNAWNASDPRADCDGSGTIDTRDVTCFLNLWTAGC